MAIRDPDTILHGETAARWDKLSRFTAWCLLAAILLPFLLAIDLPVEYTLTSLRMRGFFRDLLNVAEVFGNGFGVALVLVVITTLDPLRRNALPRLAACAFGAGMAADLIKLLVSRERPRVVDLLGTQVWDTFGGLLPMFSGNSDLQSFPSAHSATAAGLAVGLAALYPQGRWLFVTLTIGVGLQRMFTGAHFPSDVAVSLVLGYTVARAVQSVGQRFRKTGETFTVGARQQDTSAPGTQRAA